MNLFIVSLTIFVDVVLSYSLHGAGDWWSGEYTCLMKGATHLATIENELDLMNFTNICDNNNQNNNCWIGLNNYYSSDSEWFWLSHGGDDDSGLEIVSFYQLTGLNISESIAESCVFYNGTSNKFEFGDCDDKSLNYSFICDDDYHDKARERYVRLPLKRNWFNGQKFCSSKYGSNLANIMNSSENEYIWLLSEVNSLNSSEISITYWIGLYNFLHDSDDASLFVWTDYYQENFLDSSYRNWNDSIIKNDFQLTYDCVYYDVLSQTWLSDDCGNNKDHFLVCNNPFYNIKHDYEYYTRPGADRYVFAPSIVNPQLGYQNWFEARISCLLFYNTHLATITNLYENDLAQNYSFVFKNFDTNVDSFYFGYFDVGQIEGEFRWDNLHIGRLNNYTNWETNSGSNNNNDNINNNQDCAVLLQQDGTWNDTNCYSRNIGSICDNPVIADSDSSDMIENNVSYISIHACSNWNNLVTFELRNTMHVVIKDISGATTDYISINVNEGLALAGYWKTYEINDTYLSNNINGNDIFSISIGISQSDVVYCIDGFLAVINGESYVLNDQLKGGIVLSQNCENNFYYDYNSEIFDYCNQGLYTMYTYYGSNLINNMYKLSLRTCAINGADIDFNNVDLSISLIGKDKDSNTWVSSDSILLNHVSMTGNIQWSNVGTLLATNLVLHSNGTKEIMSVDHDGILIGIKIVISNQDLHYGDKNFFSFDKWQFSIDNCGSNSNCQSDSTVSMFYGPNSYSTSLNDEIWIVVRPDIGQTRVNDSNFALSVDDYIQFYFSNVTKAQNDIGNDAFVIVHIYGIFEEELDHYYLPYQFIGLNTTQSLTWSQSDEYCMNNYGTHLASIHSSDEMLAALLVKKGSQAWIGLTDRYNEGNTDGNIFEWNDYTSLNYQHWGDGEPNMFAGFEEDCVNIYYGAWNDARCSLTRNWLYFICGKRVWNNNIEKTFNIPLQSTFSSDEVVMISITNSDLTNGEKEEAICIDSVSVNGIFAQSIPNRWVGDSNSDDCDNNDCSPTVYAIMKWPVCTIEIIRTTLVWNEMDYDETDSSISGLTCSNYNRLHQSTCHVSQSFTFETYTDIEFSESQTFETVSSVSQTKGESIATESSSTIGNTFSHSQSTSVNIGQSHEISSSTTAGIGFEYGSQFAKVSASIEKTVSHAHSFNHEVTDTDEETQTSIFEETSSTISERYSDVTRQHSTSSSDSRTDTMTVGTSTSNTIECVASMNIPPSTSIDYYFTFTETQAIIPTLTDLKLTMCSYYLSASDDDTEDDTDDTDLENSVMYIYDIKGEIAVDVVSNCDVSFNAPIILGNEMDCYQELQLSFLSNAPFVPICNKTHPQFYDGCQCTGVNLYSSPRMCMCVDIYGTPLETSKGILHDNDDDWRDTCKQLNCENSIFNAESSTSSTTSTSSTMSTTSTSSTSSTMSTTSTTGSTTTNPTNSQLVINNSTKMSIDFQSIIIIILVNILVVLCCGICLLLIYVCKYGFMQPRSGKRKEDENIAQTIIDQRKKPNVEMSTEIDIVTH